MHTASSKPLNPLAVSDNVPLGKAEHEQAMTPEGGRLFWEGTIVPMSKASYRAAKRVFERNPNHTYADHHDLLTNRPSSTTRQQCASGEQS